MAFEAADQTTLIAKLNSYLQSQARPLLDTAGYCNGLASLYLYAQTQNKHDEFFSQIKYILSKEDNGKSDPTIDRFIEKIHLLNMPGQFMQNMTQSRLDRSIEMVRERGEPQLRREFNIAFSFTQAELSKILEDIPNQKMILIRSNLHAIAVYKNEGKYYCYDPNNRFETTDSTASQAAVSIQNAMELLPAENQSKFLPLEINVFDRTDKPESHYQNAAEVVDEFLANEPNIERSTLWDGFSPLCMAALAGNAEIVRSLLKKGADPNIQATVSFDSNSGKSIYMSPLDLASISKDEATVKALLEYGAIADAKNSLGCTALNTAVHSGNEAIAKILLEYGSDPNEINAQGQSLLRTAVNLDNGAMAKLLLEHGANPNVADARGATPLMEAVFNNNLSMARLLLEHKANPNLTSVSGRTALMLAAQKANPAMISLLLEKGANPFALNKQGQSAIDIAIQSGQLKAAQTLLTAAQIQFKAVTYFAAFKLAVNQSHYKIGFQILRTALTALFGKSANAEKTNQSLPQAFFAAKKSKTQAAYRNQLDGPKAGG
ncbi:MAG: ubiquitin-protein ligase MIB2-like [Gammaproteobacteria bacterium]|jgi:ankyrin repeat protein|nr:ubiquitin-protein ligase MIB2-like [Gammaproteobacteria bacterium]